MASTTRHGFHILNNLITPPGRKVAILVVRIWKPFLKAKQLQNTCALMANRLRVVRESTSSYY